MTRLSLRVAWFIPSSPSLLGFIPTLALLASCVDLSRPIELTCQGDECPGAVLDAAAGGSGGSGGTRPLDMASASPRDAAGGGGGGGGAGDARAPGDAAAPGRADAAVMLDAAAASVDATADAPVAADTRAVPMPNGAACTTREQCTSGLCIDGVCCNALCNLSCQSCNVAGLEGTCAPVPLGQDPDDECVAQAATTCGLDGFCDGNGKCNFHDATTVCGPRVCVDGVESAVRRCDGKGKCRTARLKSCAPYACDGDRCATTCVPGASCGARGACLATGKCPGLLALGEACTKASDCTSGQCVNGVCCENSCSGRNCHACNVPEYVGLCHPVGKGTDPLGSCGRDEPATCGRNGFCDGNGACDLWNAATVCLGGLCAGNVESSPRLCNGLNTCRGPVRMRTCRDGCGDRMCRACPPGGCEDAGSAADASDDALTGDAPAGDAASVDAPISPEALADTPGSAGDAGTPDAVVDAPAPG